MASNNIFRDNRYHYRYNFKWIKKNVNIFLNVNKHFKINRICNKKSLKCIV